MTDAICRMRRYRRQINIPLALILILSCVSNNLYAKDIGSTKISYATGKRSQEDINEDRDTSGDFTFYRYGVSTDFTPADSLRYRISYKEYKKDFTSGKNGLDNRRYAYDALLSLPLDKDRGRHLDLDYNLTAKRYNNSPGLEYDNNNISAAVDVCKNDRFSLKAAGGIKDYAFIKNSNADYLKSFFKASPGVKILDDITVSGYYRRVWVNRANREKDYTEDNLSLRTAIRLRNSLLDKVSGRIGYGRSDSREANRNREDGLRFEYKLWDITTQQRPAEALRNRISYGQKERDYFTSVNSYHNWFIKDTARIRVYKNNGFTLGLLARGEHKEVRFYENESLSYKRGLFSAGMDILKRKAYSLKPAFTFTRYDYPPNSSKNQRNYKIDLSLKKYIGSTDKSLGLSYWYKWKDFKSAPDIEQWALNLSLGYRF